MLPIIYTLIDKNGDAYSFSLEKDSPREKPPDDKQDMFSEDELEPLLGHFSMLLDLVSILFFCHFCERFHA